MGATRLRDPLEREDLLSGAASTISDSYLLGAPLIGDGIFPPLSVVEGIREDSRRLFGFVSPSSGLLRLLNRTINY